MSGDRYAGEWPRERFREHGIAYEPAAQTKSDLYRELLPLLNSRRCEFLDYPRLVNQICSLERRTARGGRDSIDHPAGAHDDFANAAAGVLVGLAGGPRFPGWGIFEVYRQRAEELARRKEEAARAAKPAPVYARGSVEWAAQQLAEKEKTV